MSKILTDKIPSSLSYWRNNQPNNIALLCSNKIISWSELGSTIDRLSVTLNSQGVSQGSVVALVSKNCTELLLAYLACIQVGALASIIAPTTPAQVSKKLSSLGRCHLWLGVGAEKNHLLYDNDYIGLNLPIEWRGEVTDTASPSLKSSDLASIIFTSGSTGSPKAVVHTKQQHIASAKGLLERFVFEVNDVWLLSLPMFHVSGLAIVWRWLVTGACLKVGEGKQLYTDLQGVSHASLVATQLKRLLDDGRELTLSRVLLGGSHIPISLAQQANLRGIDTWLGYGMTEAASTVMAKRVDERPGVGVILPKRAIKIENKRIYVGGETIASGYFERGVITPITRDGWFDSHDLGEWDGEEICILGRSDNLFISGGENIHCEEIESVLSLHPKITSAIVVAVKNTEYGARPIAVVQCVDTITKSDYEDFIATHLEKLKWPIDYLLMPESITNQSTIKVSRLQVKQWLAKAYPCYVPL